MRNIQVNMQFNADTTAAKSQIQQLQQSLQSVANTKITVQGGSIDQATQSARILQQHLTAATNVDTGRLNFSALQASLKSANMDLNTLTSSLVAAGPAGQKAFSQVANAVAHAELSVKKTNSALAAFGTTLMNTIKWQVASMMIHATMSAFSDAVGHIKNLDSALNSIQIVTGKTATEMANFAKQAQNLSKELSSTTEEYAKASLIFFQQGLGEKEVLERTEATIKMAKVTGDAVETVSNQLTAIWNNFDDGTKHLEHYVDVITALGAATASSTSEISDGLQKFAAIAETVGLSYEYAATALATVTAETRQSADVVGTAFKTLFARMEGLKLGETLDDGTTFNQYSEAMLKAGINIKDSAGNLKDMNDILDEMGEKWKTLNKDQQIALAQQVGGIRQYNQLMALMSNWDTFKVNLEIAEDSKGTLDEQFEIYQGSVEASAASLKNATQALYENLLDPSTISSFNEGLEDAVNLVNTLVENAGGLGKVLQFGGLLLLQMVLPKLQMFLTNASSRLMEFIGYTKALQLDTMTQQSNTAHTIAGTASQSAWQTGRSNTFLPNTAGITQISAEENLSGADLRIQMVKEEAGFTASILDTKRQILALENGMTAKQKEGYKLYQNQIAQEQESLRIAREKQATTADTSKKSSRDAATLVGVSKGGKQYKESIRDAEIKRIESERAAEHSRKEKLGGDTAARQKISKDIDTKYNKQLMEAQTKKFDSRKIDLSGEATKTTIEGLEDGVSEAGQNLTQNMIQGLTQSLDGSGPAASIENLEKLGQAQAQYNTDAAKANGIYTELSGNIGEAGKRTQEQQQILQATQKTMNALGTDAKKGLLENLKKSASEAAKGGKNVSRLQETLAECGDDISKIDLSKLNPDELAVAQTATKNLGQGLEEASTSAGALVDAMSQDISKATGKDAKVFQGVAEDARIAKQGAIEADDAAQRLHGTLNKQPPIMRDPFGAVLQGAQQATAAFTSFAMGAQMLSTGITTAFNEDATAVEQLMGAMMILQGVMSTLNAIKTASNLIDTIALSLKTGKTAATAAETAAEEGNTIVTDKNTTATSANAVARFLAAIASKGWAGIIAGALGAALIVGTILTVKSTRATQQETKAKEMAAKQSAETAEKHKENAESLVKEAEAANKDAEAYRQLYQAYLETGEVASDLTEKTHELATALEIENANLLILQKNYDLLNKKIEENLKKKNKAALDAARENKQSAGQNFATKVGTNDNYSASDSVIKIVANEQDFWNEWTEDTEWINKFLFSEEGQKYAEAGIAYQNGSLTINYNGAEQIPEMMALFTEMMESDQFKKAARMGGYDTVSGLLFQNWYDMKDAAGETFDALSESENLFTNASIANGIAEVGLGAINNVADFKTAYDNLILDVLKSNDIDDINSEKGQNLIKKIDEYLNENDAYSEMFAKFKASNELSDNVKQYLANQHDGDNSKITNEEYELATRVVIDEHALPDEVDAFINYAQTLLDEENLKKTVDLTYELEDRIDDNKTYDDWTEFKNYIKEQDQDYYERLGFDDDNKWLEFLGMDPNSQKTYLRVHGKDYSDDVKEAENRVRDANNAYNTQVGITGRTEAQTSEKGMYFQIATMLRNFDSNQNPAELEDLGPLYGVSPTDLLNYATLDEYDRMWEIVKAAVDAKLIDPPTWWPREKPTDPAELSKHAIQHYKDYNEIFKQLASILNTKTGADLFAIGDKLEFFTTYYDAASGERSSSKVTGTDLIINDNEWGTYFSDGNYQVDENGNVTTDYVEQYAASKANEEYYAGEREKAEQNLLVAQGAQFRIQIDKEALDVQEVMDYATALKQVHAATVETTEESQTLGLVNSKMTRGLKLVVDNFEDIEDGLKAGATNLRAYSKALNLMKESVKDIFNVKDPGAEFSEAFLSSVKNAELLKKAAEGDIQALQDFRAEAMKDYIVNAEFKDGVSDKLIELVDTFTNSQELDNLEIGASLDTTSIYQQLQEMLMNGEITADQMSAMLQRIGGTPPISYIEVPASQASTFATEQQNEVLVPDPSVEGGYRTEKLTTESDFTALGDSMVRIPIVGEVDMNQVKRAGGKIGMISSFTGNDTSKILKPKDSSGSKPKKTSEAKKKKSEIVDRYKEIDDKLDDTQNAMDKASKVMDRLYGPKRLKEMEKINKTLQTEIKQLKEKRKEAEQYLKIDQQDLNKAASALNISFTFDNGNISNYEEAMTSVYNKREALLKSFGSTINEKEQEQLDALDKKIEELKAAVEQYDETRELTEDLDNEIQDAVNEWQDNNYEQLTYKLELQVEINDRDLEVLEYYLSKTEDDFYKQAEGIGYLTQQIGIYNDKLEDNQNHLADLQQKYKDGDISQANYIEGLKEIFSTTMADAQALADLDKQMLEYYGNTLDMASEEISKYTDRMEHQTSVLEHFKNIMDIIGESTNYEALGVILEGQAQTIENELKVAQESYAFYQNEADQKKKLLEALADGDSAAAEIYQKEWEAAEEKAREAQDNMLSETKEWAESMKAILENNLAGLAQELENALTGGTSFETVTTQMERVASLQEDYLTTTNKIYETNKMINAAQKEIDKTTNSVAKQKLKNFQRETTQLQDQTKLSQYELDIQQAKYDLLLAEIALEEAQQAKSTVRLQRDSEGNFGYVYTADANAVADAEQKLADAQNNLYNIGLDGANDYAQKYQQTMQEMADTLKDITEKYRNGEYESEEEYHQAMEDAKAYYFQKLQDYSNLYQVALTTDSRVIADAWSTDFGIMTTKTEDWKKAVNKYLSEVNGAFEGWEKVVKRVKAETVGQDLDALKDKTQAIVDVSEDLSEQITKKGGIIDSIEAEMAAVSAITSTYAQWGQAIAATIAANEKLMHQTNAIIAEESGGKSSVSSKDGNLKTDNKDKGDVVTGTAGASGNNNTSSEQPSLAGGSKVTVKKTARHFSRDGGNGTKMQDWVPGYTFTVIDIDGNEVLIGKGNSYSQATGWVRKTDLEGFKTGGYTGSWGSEGKLAMLHQKELILNADDTANFLASLEILREIINAIDLHSAHAQLSGLLSSPAYHDYNEPQTLEQQVYIEASFPNVSDRHEIEEAFTNLVNRASQFVNRK